MNLLGGLGSDYNAIVIAINIRDDKISIEQQSSIEQFSPISPIMPLHLIARMNHNPNTSNYTYRGRGRGGRYGQNGRHNSNSSEKPQCQLCGKFGHTVQICYHRFDISYQSSQSSNTSPSNAGNPNSMPAMVASSNNLADDTWYLDSERSSSTQSVSNLTVTIGNSNTGSHRLLSIHILFISKGVSCPFISANLISVAKFCSHNNALIEFRSNSFFVKDLHTKKVLAQGRLENGLYRFPLLNKKVAFVGATNSSTFYSHNSSIFDNKVTLWHHRLGHASTDIVTQIMQSCNVSFEKNKNTVCSTVCSSCQLAKSHRLPTHLSLSCASKPLELVHTDLWGPASVKSTSGARYFILFLDDYSRYTWFYPLQTKDQALPAFKKFKLQVENQFDAKIKCLQSDNGGEFRSFKTFLQQTGIFHRFSCPYNSAQNGRVERKHRHVVETGLALQLHFLSIECQVRYSKITPLFHTFQKVPDYKSLRVFGCLCYPFIRPYNSHKLQYRSVQSLFLGYSLHNKGFLSQTHPISPTKDISTDILTPAIITSFPSPTFRSNGSHTSSLFPLLPRVKLRFVSSPIILPPLVPYQAIHKVQPPSSSLAPRMTTRLMRGITKKKTILISLTLKDPNWIQAMDLEIVKWVYKLKHKPMGGYNQTHGLDYFETFSPWLRLQPFELY
ncbi:hypothetical protein AAG906_026677 [Vitis piasezkii]